MNCRCGCGRTITRDTERNGIGFVRGHYTPHFGESLLLKLSGKFVRDFHLWMLDDAAGGNELQELTAEFVDAVRRLCPNVTALEVDHD